MVTFRVRNGLVDLRASLRVARGHFARSLPDLVQRSECSMLDLLLAAPCLSRKLNKNFGYLPQLVWVLGPMLETLILGVNPTSPDAESWWESSTLGSLPSALQRHQRAPFAYAYSEASYKAFKDCSVLSIAVDDGRVGRTPWKLGAIMSPSSNLSAWLLPQVVGQPIHTHRSDR